MLKYRTKQKFFHGAHDRYGGRQRRQKKAAQKLETSPDVNDKSPSLTDRTMNSDSAGDETVEQWTSDTKELADCD